MRRSATLSGLAFLVLAGPVHAQVTAQGWIGISYEVRAEDDGSRAVVVTEVVRESPAGRGGIRVGDRLISIDDLVGADELEDLPRRLDLRAGQQVTVRLERADRRVRLRLRAAERPLSAFRVSGIGASTRSDSLVEVTFRAMDSLRTRILRERGPNRRTGGALGRSEGPDGSARAATPTGFDVEDRLGRRGVGTPFEFFVFRGESHDSLLREMRELERALERLRREQDTRLEELRGSSRSRRGAEQDRELRNVREAMEELTRRSDRLAAAMSEAARATAGIEYMLTRAPDQRRGGGESRVGRGSRVGGEPGVGREPDRSSGAGGPELEGFRPLTPYLLGSNRVAGAQVVAIEPELGAYFGVSDGVLVVDVAPGTPAAIAGMRPGDVVTRLDQVGVRSVQDLRFGVAQAGDTLPVTLIRRGSSFQVLLRRR